MRWVVQLCLGTMFALSAASKIGNPRGFARGVEEYRILPRRVAFLFALLVILCEIFLSLSHIFGWLLVYAVPVGVAMLCSFFVAVSVNLARKRNLPCFCFGGYEQEPISSRSLARLAIAILGELLLLLHPGFFDNSFPRAASHASAQDVVLAGTWTLFVLIATLWVLSLPDLLRLVLSKLHWQHASPSHSLRNGRT